MQFASHSRILRTRYLLTTQSSRGDDLKLKKIIYFMAVFIPLSSSAWTLLSHTEDSADSFLELVKGYGSFAHPENAPFALDSWSLGAGTGQNQITNTDGSEATLISQQYRAGIGAEIQKNWDLRIDGNATSTPSVKFTDRGLTLSLGYTAEYGGGPEDVFIPSVTVTARVGQDSLKQDFNFKVQGVRTFDMNQTSSGLDVDWDFAARWSLFASAMTYNYNKSSADLAAATQAKVSTEAVNNFASTIESEPSSKLTGGLSFYPAPRWDTTLTLGYSKMFIDGSSQRSAEFDVRYRFLSGFILGAGVRAITEDSGNEQIALLDLGWRF